MKTFFKFIEDLDKYGTTDVNLSSVMGGEDNYANSLQVLIKLAYERYPQKTFDFFEELSLLDEDIKDELKNLKGEKNDVSTDVDDNDKEEYVQPQADMSGDSEESI